MYGLMGAAIAPLLVMAPASAATLLESSPSERVTERASERASEGETVVDNGSVGLIDAPALPSTAYALMGITAVALVAAGSRKLPEYELEPIRVKSK